MKTVLQMGRKHCGKRRDCSLRAISPFSQNVFKENVLQSLKYRACLRKSLVTKAAKNGGKFSERVENTVGKGEIARYEQFLLFPQCFQKTCTADT